MSSSIEIRPKYGHNDFRDWRVFIDGVAVADCTTFRRQRVFGLIGTEIATDAPKATARRIVAEPRRVIGLLFACGINVDGDVTINPQPPEWLCA